MPLNKVARVQTTSGEKVSNCIQNKHDKSTDPQSIANTLWECIAPLASGVMTLTADQVPTASPLSARETKREDHRLHPAMAARHLQHQTQRRIA